MRTLILLAAVISGLWFPAVHADERGKVLVTKDRRITEGDIERLGDRFIIRRGEGQTILRSEQVLFLVNSRSEAYQRLLATIDAKDVMARVELSRWCYAHGLREEALVEARAASELRPDDAGLQRMTEMLERALDRPVLKPVKMEEPSTEEVREIDEPANFNAASVPLFATRVQPLLMNKCIRCHGGSGTSEFRLNRLAIGERDRRATHHNLTATLAHIDRKNPAASPLLSKAVVAHGDDPTPPIFDRSQASYRLLESWVRLVVAPEGTTIPGYDEPTVETPSGLQPVNAIPSQLPVPVGIPVGVGVPPPVTPEPFDPTRDEDFSSDR